MKFSSFARFVSPSVILMAMLMALPLLMTFVLSARNCVAITETVEIVESGPFGEKKSITQRTKIDSSGKPLQQCEFVGLMYYRRVLGLEQNAVQNAAEQTGVSSASNTSASPVRNEFFDALRFTLTYVAATTPFVIAIGLLLALAVNRLNATWRLIVIPIALLPFIMTPVVAALTIKWLFRDDGLAAQLLSSVGINVFWMAQSWSAQLLVVLYGIWHVVPFAFIVFYAGLQTVPQDSLEAARIDGASPVQSFVYVTLPHLMPLVVFVLLIHVMDAYRVFEPVVVLTQGAFTTSVQYLSYYVLLQENNPYKASAASVLTMVGIAILLIPLLRRTWREQRRGYA